jgi:hypothetical protein
MLHREHSLAYIREVKLKKWSYTVTASGGLCGCWMLRIPHCLDNRLTEGGEVVSPTRRQSSIL